MFGVNPWLLHRDITPSKPFGDSSLEINTKSSSLISSNVMYSFFDNGLPVDITMLDFELKIVSYTMSGASSISKESVNIISRLPPISFSLSALKLCFSKTMFMPLCRSLKHFTKGGRKLSVSMVSRQPIVMEPSSPRSFFEDFSIAS